MRKRHLTTLLAALLAVTWSGVLRADFNAQQIADAFNALNGNTGYDFMYVSNVPPTLQATPGTTMVDVSPYNNYASSSATSFRSFCVNTFDTVSVGQRYLGNLNIQDDGTTQSMQNNTALTVGAAYLYKIFATEPVTGAAPYNIFSNLNIENRAAQLQDAIHYLMGLSTAGPDIWNTNIYLQFLVQEHPERSLDYWTNTYLSTERYTEIGDYFVFVMNVNHATTVTTGQDFLYLARATWTASAVPEPATLLLWTLGSVGALGISHYRRRNEKA